MTERFDDSADHLIPVYDRLPVNFKKGEGCYLYDDTGSRYLDALAGIAVNVLGYRHPRLEKAAVKSARDIYHVSNLFEIDVQAELARRLSELSFDTSAFFCNSGAEANEAAIKFARRYSERYGSGGKKIVSFENSFHGRTLGALAATGQKKYHEGFGPLPGGFEYIPYNDPTALREALGKQTCALFMEPVQGEGGVIPAEPGFFSEVREVCSQENVLLVLDEVQTGMGRTGEFFCYQNYDLEPDVVTLAKGLGGGFPVGALLVRHEFREGLQSGEHASTFGGNPFACRMALKVLKVLETEDLLASVEKRGEQLRTGLTDLSEKYDFVSPPRGMGLMLALPLAESFDSGKVMRKALETGLVVGVAGRNSLRFVPPLVISEAEVNELLEKLDDSLDNLR